MNRSRSYAVTAALLLGLLAAPGAAPAGAAPSTGAVATSPGRPAVVEVRTIGRSVRGRPIRAWRLGEPGKRRIVLV